MPLAVSAPRKGADFELLLSIGGVVGHVVLEGPSVEFVTAVEERFAGFCLPNNPQVNRIFSLRLRCDSQAGPGDPQPDGAGRFAPHALRVEAAGNSVRIERGDFAATLTRPIQSAGPSEGRGRTRETLRAFESLLRVLWSIYLPRAGGILMHACGLQTSGCGLLAPAGSGVGKTTLARKAGADVLADEIMAVHRGSDRRWRLSATPFFGEASVGQPSMRSFPLVGITFLEQRPSLHVERLALTAAVGRGLGCVISFDMSNASIERNLAIVIDLCQQVPALACGTSAETPWHTIRESLRPHLSLATPTRNAPDNIRELVAALRGNLQLHGRYAFAPRGGSMRPFVQSGDTVFVETVDEAAVRAGDVLLYWRAGATADADTLTCHRMIGRVRGDEGEVFLTKGDALSFIEAFHVDGAAGARAELIGRVHAISREGQTHSWSVPGRLGSLAIVMASLLTAGFLPLSRLVARK